jgi:hypothetical protein
MLVLDKWLRKNVFVDGMHVMIRGPLDGNKRDLPSQRQWLEETRSCR